MQRESVRIGIIGAGLSGRLLALNLLTVRVPASPASIALIDPRDERSAGPAYSDPADYLLLNVPASRMGAFSSDPEHFLNETAALVINTMGPESDYRRIGQPLVVNLQRRGLMRPGPAFLGIDALPNGALIGRDGEASTVLYTLGSTMRGVLWEVLAVPEIRVQAECLAQMILA